MAHGLRASLKVIHLKDYWSKRPLSNHSGHPLSKRSKVNKKFKRLTHRIEQMQAKEIIFKELKGTEA